MWIFHSFPSIIVQNIMEMPKMLASPGIILELLYLYVFLYKKACISRAYPRCLCNLHFYLSLLEFFKALQPFFA